MKITLRKKALLGALSLATFGVLSASAMGPGLMMNSTLTPDEIATKQTSMFQKQATLLGATLDEVKTAWANGTSMVELAKSKGITETQLQAKLKAERDQQMKNQLATLVSKGVITQAQADKRLATMSAKLANGKNGMKASRMHGGMMGGLF